MQELKKQSHGGHYGRLIAMMVLSFIAMYILMYGMVNAFANVYMNVNQVYMAGLMAAPMGVIELALMRAMYPDRRLNAVVVAGSLLALAVFWALLREQVAVSDRQFLRSMIPHHAGAILMCEQSPIQDAEIKRLCEAIISSQQSEIDQMPVDRGDRLGGLQAFRHDAVRHAAADARAPAGAGNCFEAGSRSSRRHSAQMGVSALVRSARDPWACRPFPSIGVGRTRPLSPRDASAWQMWPQVAIIPVVASTGIRELKDNLSRYIRRIEAGERIVITAHGRVVAELVPPGTKTTGMASRFDELVASGVIRPPLEAGDPTEDWPAIALPPGTAAELIDADRGEA